MSNSVGIWFESQKKCRSWIQRITRSLIGELKIPHLLVMKPIESRYDYLCGVLGTLMECLKPLIRGAR